MKEITSKGLLVCLCALGILLLVPAGRSGAAGVTLLAAGERLLAYRIPDDVAPRVSSSTHDSPKPAGPDQDGQHAFDPIAVPDGWEGFGDARALGPCSDQIDLPAPAIEMRVIPEKAAVVVNTAAGLFRCDVVEPAGVPQLDPLIPLGVAGARSIDVGPDGSVYLLDAMEQSFEDSLAVFEILVVRPGNPETPIHLGYAPALSSRLCLNPGDGLLWIPQDIGREVGLARQTEREWTIDTVALAPPPERTRMDPYHWSLSTFVPVSTGGPLVIERGRGLSPRLLRIDPSGEYQEVFAWSESFHVRSAISTERDDLLLINTVTAIVLHLPTAGREARIQSPHHIQTLAVSPDGRTIAVALAPDREHSRIDVLHLDPPRRAQSVLIDGKIKGLVLVETG